MVWNAKHCSTLYLAYQYRYGFNYYYVLRLIYILASPFFFFFLVLKFIRKTKEKEVAKNYIEQSKSYEQQNDKK